VERRSSRRVLHSLEDDLGVPSSHTHPFCFARPCSPYMLGLERRFMDETIHSRPRPIH
jgi:hypothetical protein